jgi:excisionase family DNA binding protein
MTIRRRLETPPPARRAFSVTEVGIALDLSRSTLYALMRTGELPYVTIGHRRRIPADAIEALIGGRRRIPIDAHGEPKP